MSAQQVTEQEALSKAKRFFNRSDVASRRTARKPTQFTLANDRNEFYVFNDEANGGYVVVSGDERMPDVLGYSYTGHFDVENIPCNMKAWLEDYAKQVEYLRTHPEAQVTRRTATEREEVSPMLKCHFSQQGDYSEKCPRINGGKCPTGCVATAMAQIMYYYQWPKQTTDVIPGYTTYTLKIHMSAIPVTTIDWDNIQEQYVWWEDYSDEQKDAISTLMLLCGTSVYMDYHPDGSGAGTGNAAIAFSKYFDYDDILEYVGRGKWELDEWERMLYDELSGGRPVMYDAFSATMGHAFVLDGYKDGYFHVNWGWGGSSDDYFLLTDLNGFNYGQGAVVGIQPVNPDNPSRYAVLDNGKITMYYDKEKSHRAGTILPHMNEWSNYKEQITECVIDPSFANLQPRSLNSFFYEWSQLKSIEGLNNLITSNVRNMYGMFRGCSSLTSLEVSGFKTDNVTNMGSMFYGCSSLTSLDVSGFKTDNVTDMGYMFSGCSSLTSLDVSGFKTDNVTSMGGMFYGCSSLTNLDVSGFKTDNVTDMGYMFSDCSSLTNLDVSNFKTDNVTDMRDMFSLCSGLTSLDVSGFKTDKVTDMRDMFSLCSGLTSLDVSGFKTDNVTDMRGMFVGCSGLTSLDVSGFKTDNVANMGSLFFGCSRLTNLDVSGFKTDNVTDMSTMFASCSRLTSLDVSNFKTDNVTDMDGMFSDCSSLTSLDVSNFKTDNVTDMSWMFFNNYKITTIYVSEHWNTSHVTVSDDMFEYCSNLIGGAGTPHDANHTDAEYAHIDGGPENPGYFTYKASNFYTITYLIDDVVYKTENVDVGSTITPPSVPEREGYTFSGWSDIPETMPAHDITVIGTFIKMIIPGDVNDDYKVDIQDATLTVNYILGVESDEYDYSVADMNNDGEIDVFDVQAIVNVILSNDNTASARRNNRAYGAGVESVLLTADNNSLLLAINNPERFTSFQFDVEVPEGMSLSDVTWTGVTEHSLQFSKTGDNRYTVVALSMGSTPLPALSSRLVKLHLSDGAKGEVVLDNILFVTPKGEAVHFSSSRANIVTGIQEVTRMEDKKIYDLSGRQLKTNPSQLLKGVYIINKKKVVVK